MLLCSVACDSVVAAGGQNPHLAVASCAALHAHFGRRRLTRVHGFVIVALRFPVPFGTPLDVRTYYFGAYVHSPLWLSWLYFDAF